MSHPLVRTGRNYLIAGALFGVIAPVPSIVGLGLSPATLLAGLASAFFLWNGRALRTSGIAIPLLTESLSLITKGKLEEAEAVPGALPPAVARKPMIARAITSQRALIALMRGDTARAEAVATESVALPGGFFTRDWDEVQRTEALATRALARAAQGESAKALEDAAAIEASSHALSSALARASLVRAIVLSRSGDKTALGDHLKAHGSLILEYVMPRERSLARALRAMACVPGKSVYREAARPADQSTEEGSVRSWIGQVAPDAAGYAPREVYVDGGEAPAPQADPVAMRTIANARAAATPPKRNKMLAPWAVIILLLVSVWGWLSPSEQEPDVPAPASAEPSSFGIWDFSLGLIAVLVAFVAWWMRRYRSQQRRIFAADRDIALGRTDAGRKELLTLSTSPYPALAASARLALAALANKEGRFAEAVIEADLGIALCNKNPTTRALTSDHCAPALLGERALALAAMDRHAEAETELANLTNGFPTYALMSRALFRVRLVAAVRRRDLEAAARIALSRRPEMPLDLKIDLLADVALAASGDPMSADERERIAIELRAMPEVSAWVERVAGDLSRIRVPPATLDEKEDPQGAARRELRSAGYRSNRTPHAPDMEDSADAIECKRHTD
ncbi:MAG: hypothetical protein KIT84_42275 [Labilithrix sp.]|nr:hypothetical protein [Labilithrix sp.]MCW5817703.1 hypothetical protein [Labilithrix sp.]